MGTVIEFNDGQDRKVLVLDAIYREKWLQMGSTVDTSLINYTAKNNNDTWYINGGNESTTPTACATLTDEQLNALWWKDESTSKNNTDVLLESVNYCEAVEHCRSIEVNGVGCDLPNFQTLQRIYCEGVTLDSLDPTVANHSDLSLSNFFNMVWTSTEYNSSSNWRIESSGRCTSSARYNDCAVIPVLEL